MCWAASLAQRTLLQKLLQLLTLQVVVSCSRLCLLQVQALCVKPGHSVYCSEQLLLCMLHWVQFDQNTTRTQLLVLLRFYVKPNEFLAGVAQSLQAKQKGTVYWSAAQLSAAYSSGNITPTEVVENVLKHVAESQQSQPPMSYFIASDSSAVREQAAQSTIRWRPTFPHHVPCIVWQRRHHLACNQCI